MRNRSKTNRKIDKRIFTNTASKVKAVNLPNRIYRGGIRF